MTAPVQVQILVVPDYPHAAPAGRDGHPAARRAEPLGHRCSDHSGDRRSAGGGTGVRPTVLVNGVDPFAGSTDQAGLGCRLYRTPAGLSGLPDADLLRAALSAAMTDERAQ